MIFDMHVHTTLSPCSGMTVDEALRCTRERGLDGICITDHDTMDIRHTLSEGIQENGICVIFGMEYSTAQGDFLVFGPFERLAPNLPAHQLMQAVEQNGGVAVAAHPFRRKRPVNENIIREGLCGAIESFNGRNTLAENMAVERWRRCYDLIECGGSDAHTTNEVGTFATRFFVPILTRSDLITALKERLCRPEIPSFVHAGDRAACQNPTIPSFRPAPSTNYV